ncbi:hypothetical protein M2271_002114 [Streptomyces sp. LBL]|nr:hypothetical protein [Streptomyces sp. LBL]
MNTGHPRDVDPSITGQPHQETGNVPDLMGNISRTLGTPVNMPAAVRILVPPQPFSGTHDSAQRQAPGASLPAPRSLREVRYAAPRCNASHTAVDSRAPSSIARPQWPIQAAMPSGVPET